MAELWAEMMAHHEAFDPRFAVVQDGQALYEDYLRDLLAGMDQRVFVAEFDGRVVGYTIAMILTNPQIFQLPRYGFVAEMCVTASLRGSGIGKRLWEAAIDWFKRRRIAVVQLNVSTLNRAGQDFWRDRGCQDFLHVLWYDIPASESW